jgi:pyrroloquinoline quinone (PQQ) biosynthesis protein C
MATTVDSGTSGAVRDILAIRERWHTKHHPFFGALGEGKLPLRALGIYMAMHWQFVQRALASFGILYTRAFACEDVRKAIVENLSEEEGVKAIPREGHIPHDHGELIFRFCTAAGLSEPEVRNMKMTPAWWGRSLHYYQTALQEPIGVVLAMQTTQEGQQPALNSEVVLPALARHYGYRPGSSAIEFFTEHAEADVEHSDRQAQLCARYLDNDAVKARALEVAEQACMLRWASITDLYRRDYLGDKDILPVGVS